MTAANRIECKNCNESLNDMCRTRIAEAPLFFQRWHGGCHKSPDAATALIVGSTDFWSQVCQSCISMNCWPPCRVWKLAMYSCSLENESAKCRQSRQKMMYREKRPRKMFDWKYGQLVAREWWEGATNPQIKGWNPPPTLSQTLHEVNSMMWSTITKISEILLWLFREHCKTDPIFQIALKFCNTALCVDYVEANQHADKNSNKMFRFVRLKSLARYPFDRTQVRGENEGSSTKP